MAAQGKRLAEVRKAAGFRSARAAALNFGWAESSYRTHEGGTRTIGQDDAEKYAKAFYEAGERADARWILFGDNGDRSSAMVPVVGFVGAGAQAHLFSDGQGPFDMVEAPEGSSEFTVAVEIRGESLGSFFDHWLVFYDDIRDPVTPDLIGKLCVCGLPDGRVLIKKLARGSDRGLYTLLSQFESPIFDQPLIWAARVKNMVPR
jgi:hypothetical protein